MNNSTQHCNWIFGIRGRPAGPALALAIMFVSAVLATGSAQAQTYTERVLYSFMGGTDGAYPIAGLVRDGQGNLYGTTSGGGGCGTVFKLDATGAETVLYRFTGAGRGDGCFPTASLVRDTQGNLYGTTASGGTLRCAPPYGCGTVFKVDTTGKETVLHSFTAEQDGWRPWAGLTRDAQGTLYGTTEFGGGNYCSFFPDYAGCGTVFKVDNIGIETVLHRFTEEGDDGWNPSAGLILDAQGNLYGTTRGGGAYGRNEYGYGTVFKVDMTGKETVLYSFEGEADGNSPSAGLVLDAQGNMYGTTNGTVFKLDTTGEETVLYRFTGTGGDGALPLAGLVRDMQGDLYGTTYFGGDPACEGGCGTVFKLDTTGKETVLHSFTGTGGDGCYTSATSAGLVRDMQGNLYGTTTECGAYGMGTVFRLTPAVLPCAMCSIK
jgi:uncharacterized repeat protein (TIGR03803 family)